MHLLPAKLRITTPHHPSYYPLLLDRLKLPRKLPNQRIRIRRNRHGIEPLRQSLLGLFAAHTFASNTMSTSRGSGEGEGDVQKIEANFLLALQAAKVRAMASS